MGNLQVTLVFSARKLPVFTGLPFGEEVLQQLESYHGYSLP